MLNRVGNTRRLWLLYDAQAARGSYVASIARRGYGKDIALHLSVATGVVGYLGNCCDVVSMS